jgi:TolB protein
MSDRLRHDLADLASEVEMVDLRDRAVRTSRRMGARRAIITGTAAVVLLAGGTAAFLRLGPHQAAPPAAPTPSAAATRSPTPGPSQSAPTDFNFPAPPASASKLGPWTSSPADAFPGTALFFAGVPSNTYAVQVLANGAMHTSSLGYLDPGTSCILNTIVFSPDGTHVAWIRGNNQGPNSGQLVSTNLTTLRASAVAESASCGISPVWQSNSRSVDFARSNGAGNNPPTQTKVSLDSGETTPGRQDLLTYHAFVPGFLAYPKGGDIVVENAGGVVVHRVPYTGWPVGFSVQALSYDGRYVGVNFRNTDPDRVETVARVVDMVAGKEIELPVPTGQTMVNLQFVPDGGLVMQTTTPAGSTLLRFDRTNTVVAQTTLPPGTGLLMRYVP